jgi:hypothetical protein
MRDTQVDDATRAGSKLANGRSTAAIYLITILAIVITFAATSVADWAGLRGNLHPAYVLTVNFLASMAIGFLLYKVQRDERKRREDLEKRLKLIAELNHHVRNALATIELSAYSTKDRKTMEVISESVSRVSWALHEFLPEERGLFGLPRK